MEQQFLDFITNFGYPVALSAYLLLRFEKKFDSLTQSITDLNKVISKCSK